MCSVSFVGVQGWEKWNPIVPVQPWIYPVANPNPPTITVYPYPTPPTEAELAEFYELVRKARLYDEITGKKDCVKPDIDAWLESIEKRFESVENEIDAKLSATDLAEAIRIGLEAMGLSTEGLDEEL